MVWAKGSSLLETGVGPGTGSLTGRSPTMGRDSTEGSPGGDEETNPGSDAHSLCDFGQVP